MISISCMYVPTGWKPNQRFACFYHGVNGVGWGGVGWGGMITFICTSSHIWCYAAVIRLALPHIYDATLLYVVLHFLTYMMLRSCMSSCTSSHIWCYAIVCRLALPHIYDATVLYVVLHFLTYMMLRYCVVWGGVGWDDNVHLHFLTYMMLRCCNSSCTSSHIWCYALVRRLALPHIYDATLL